MIKKYILSLIFISQFPLHSFEGVDFFSFMNSAEEQDSLDDIFTPDVMDYEKPLYTPLRTLEGFTRSCETSCDGIIPLQNIFQRDLYRFTHPINQRSLQDLPQFYFYSCLPCWCGDKTWQPFVDLFYNETHKGNFTKDGTGISSYLAFENIPSLEQFLVDLDIQRVLSLFENLKIQERRAGAMIGAAYRYKNWYFSFRTPLEYLIRNFFLNEQEVKNIQAEPLFNDDDPSTGDEEEVKKFAREHLIADRIGIGDTRIEGGRLLIDKPDRKLTVGAELTVPTAFALKKGLYGNHFSKDAPTPQLDLCELLNLAINDIPRAEKLAGDFFVSALDRLSRILLETGLGNNGHLGLGGFAEHRMCVTPKLEFRSRAALEYLVPARERRFFIRKKNLEDFERLNNFNPDNCTQELEFLQQQIVETFFPEGFNTQVHPGFIFKLTNALSGSIAKNKVHLNIGHDLWWQQGEKLGKINAPPAERERLRKDIATRPPAFQSKIFASVSYFRRGRKFDWCLKVHGDKTFLRSGIGKDFNIGIRFELLL